MEEPTETTDLVPSDVLEEPVSKNQLKKELKRQRMEEYWAYKRQKKKEAKKQRRQSSTISSPPSDTNLDSQPKQPKVEEEDIDNDAILERENKKTHLIKEFIKKCDSNFAVIIDCAFEDLHSERAFKSMCQQIMFAYGINRKHTHPVHLYVTGGSSGGPSSSNQPQKVFEKLAKCSSQNWIGFHEHTESYLTLPQFCINRHDSTQSIFDNDNTSAPTTIDDSKNSSSSANNSNNNSKGISSGDADQSIESAGVVSSSPQKQLVYLTSDATDTLDTLDPNCAYIIGGIVDRNSHKGITFQKATQQGIRTAKLPIKEYVQMAATHVLTINHVLEILLTYNATQSWPEALQSVLPKRKEFEAKVEDEV